MTKPKTPSASVGTMKVPVGNETCEIYELPTFCPRCRTDAVPTLLGAATISAAPDEWMFPTLNVPVRCQRCNLAYIAEYYGDPVNVGPQMGDVEITYTFKRTIPNAFPSRELATTLQRISPRFTQVYGEAAAAEYDSLYEVAGVGYRRALEILVKDYLIARDPDNRPEVHKTWLSNCIEKFIEDPTIQDLARRANIIATDFAHYERYGANELKDLVTLIDLVGAWIVLQEETAVVRAQLDSPNPGA